MSAQAYYQGDQSGQGGGGDRGYMAQPATGYDYNQGVQAQAANQAQSQYGQGQQYGGYPQPGQGQYAPPQQPPQVYGGNNNYNQGPQPNNYGASMKPSAPYAPQADPENQFQPQNISDTAPFSQANEKTGERMNPKPRLNDIIPLILFIATFIGFVVVSALALRDFSSVDGLGGGFGRGSGGSGTTLNLYVPSSPVMPQSPSLRFSLFGWKGKRK
jgi:hypothetical protein